MRKRSLQAEPQGAVVRCRQLLGRRHQRICEGNASGKAADAGNDITCQHRLLVVKAQPVAQCQVPDQPIFFDLVPLDHLRLRRPIRIDAVERVEDEISVSASRAGAGEVRVEHAEIFSRNKDQLARLLRPPDLRRGERGKARAGRFEQIPSAHDHLLPVSASRQLGLGHGRPRGSTQC